MVKLDAVVEILVAVNLYQLHSRTLDMAVYVQDRDKPGSERGFW
jgi:hypothetical protein